MRKTTGEELREQLRDLPMRKLKKREWQKKYGDAEDAVFDDVIPFGNPGDRHSKRLGALGAEQIAALDVMLEKAGARRILAALVSLMDSRSGDDFDSELTFDVMADGEIWRERADALEKALWTIPE